MTQKEFLNTNIPVVQAMQSVRYIICEGVVITFQKNEGENKYSLLLNGHEIERNQNYSSWAIKNSFLSVTNIYHLHSFRWHPLSDGKTYVISKDTVIPDKIHWGKIKRID